MDPMSVQRLADSVNWTLGFEWTPGIYRDLVRSIHTPADCPIFRYRIMIAQGDHIHSAGDES